MGSLKDLFMEIESEEKSDDSVVEVFADSVKSALDLASRELSIDVSMLDYEILEKGTRGFLGIGRQPYRVLVRPLENAPEHDDLDELERKLTADHHPELTLKEKKNVDGSHRIRVLKSGVWLTVSAPKGRGKLVDINDVTTKLYALRISDADMQTVEKEVKKASGKPVRIGAWKPNPEFDGSMNVEMVEDEMRAYVHFIPPRYSGRHMDFTEVITALKNNGVVTGIREKEIKEYLEQMAYLQPLLAAEGQKARNGRDAYIDYKVRVDKSNIHFEEDESGKVDFRNIELLENVVVGQILAVKVPAEEGIPGRTVTNRILPAKSGKDIKIQHGKGTILSEDGTELSAEVNGQVVVKNNKITVEPVYIVNGDVSMETGNIIFLGSVIVSGSVQDNFVVKAAGNIEVKGSVQKAFLEAEGDIIVYSGILGREEAKIESTGGSVYAKFIQNARVIAENDVVGPEGILHSFVDAGERVFSNGKRARIVGGVIRAGNEVNARFIGADVSTKTEIWVGINPKVLQQMTELESMRGKMDEELTQLKLNIRTLDTQKKSSGKLSADREKMLNEMNGQRDKLESRLEEIKIELEELKSYVGMLEQKGRVSAEKTAFPGVDIYVKDKRFSLKDPYNSVKFSMEGGEIKISNYEPPEGGKAHRFMRRRR
ncbi:MAG: FapA family protein [Spirochaetes bacterium]|nr:FapA family protein [Spirochaetota bacterium]